MRVHKGAFAAPLFFCGLAAAVAGSTIASPTLWAVALLMLLAAYADGAKVSTPGITPLAAALCGYVTWVVLNSFLNTPYSAAGIFHPAFLAGGFFFARGLDADARKRVLATLLFALALLALWALWQAGSGEGRAHAYFETPNTLATVINLGLAPLLFRIAYGDSRRIVVLLAFLLVAALVATLSRGGFIALGGGMLATMFLYRQSSRRSELASVAAVVGFGTLAGLLALQLPVWFASHAVPPEGQLRSVAGTLDGTVSSRMELYRLALSAVGQHPLLGSGYLGFRALLEEGRAHVPSYSSENVTYFVHNDYLQTLLELGVPGLLGLLATVALPFGLARRVVGSHADRLSVHGALAGVATMAIHALGDFPFYVPVCLLLFGGLLGEVDRLVAEPANATGAPARSGLVRIGIATALSLLLLPPPLAEAAAAYGQRNWRSGDGQSAAFGFELARRFQPRDWRYHWYAGQFWYAQAVQTGMAAQANRADRAFAAAVRANPDDARPLLGRLATQLRFAGMLARRQSEPTLHTWADRALALAPLNPSVRQDYAAAMAQLGLRR